MRSQMGIMGCDNRYERGQRGRWYAASWLSVLLLKTCKKRGLCSDLLAGCSVMQQVLTQSDEWLGWVTLLRMQHPNAPCAHLKARGAPHATLRHDCPAPRRHRGEYSHPASMNSVQPLMSGKWMRKWMCRHRPTLERAASGVHGYGAKISGRKLVQYIVTLSKPYLCRLSQDML